MSNFIIRKVAVLGAGVMGTQIAAHCANADLPVLLFDLPEEGAARNAKAARALEGLQRMRPSPIGDARQLQFIEAVNYDDDLARLGECDLVIEAIAEKLDLKRALYQRVAPYLHEHAIIATNTSGLSVRRLATGLPEALRERFLGLHFFNPPRYMSLVEMVTAPASDALLRDRLEGWLTSRLGKNVVRAPDTPNFIANRIGVFSMLAVMHHTERLGLGFDEADVLTGTRLGRPRSATFRTADLVGLDVLAHVIDTMRESLPDDPWHAYFRRPPWLVDCIERDALGQKRGAGVYRKRDERIQVLDPVSGDYIDSKAEIAPEVEQILACGDMAERLERLRACGHPHARLIWSSLRDLFHYCAVHLASVASNARDLDLAMRWGFGWSRGPLESWQMAGWRAVARAIRADIGAGRSMSATPLPDWVFQRDGVHQGAASYSAAENACKPRTALPVYVVRQLYPERVFGESDSDPGEVLWDNGAVCLWRRADQDPRVGIVSFRTRMHAIGQEVLDGVIESVARAERGLDGLVLWHEPPFAVGADLKQILQACEAGEFQNLEHMLVRFQQASMALRLAQVPVVAAVQGMALGGGCEFAMHAAHRVLAFESCLGLVEAGVGLIPAGGGCKGFAVQADARARRTAAGDVFPFLQPVFETIARGTVAKSAPEAVNYGFAAPADDIVMHPGELLYVALRRARALAVSGYRPPLPRRDVLVAGRDGIAACEMMLVNMAGGGFISEHDYRIARAAATALCGGELSRGSRVPEQWLLDVERAEFMALLRTEPTQQRIRHMLATGKPLRN